MLEKHYHARNGAIEEKTTYRREEDVIDLVKAYIARAYARGLHIEHDSENF